MYKNIYDKYSWGNQLASYSSEMFSVITCLYFELTLTERGYVHVTLFRAAVEELLQEAKKAEASRQGPD